MSHHQDEHNSLNVLHEDILPLERAGSFGAWEDKGEVIITRIPSVRRTLDETPTIQSPKSRLLLLDDLLMQDESGAAKLGTGDPHREPPPQSRRGSGERPESDAARPEAARVHGVRRVGSLESNTMSRTIVRTASTLAPDPSKPVVAVLERPKGRGSRPSHADTAHGSHASASPAHSPSLASLGSQAPARAISGPAKSPPLAHQAAPLAPSALADPGAAVPDAVPGAAGPAPAQPQMAIGKEETLLPWRSLPALSLPGLDRPGPDDPAVRVPAGGLGDDDSDARSQSDLSTASTQHSSASTFRRQCRRSRQLLHDLMASKARREPPRPAAAAAATPEPAPAKVPSAELSRASG